MPKTLKPREFYIQLSILKGSENYFEMTNIICLIPRINYKVINECYKKYIKIPF